MAREVQVHIKEITSKDDPTVPEGFVLLEVTSHGRDPGYFCIPEEEFTAKGGQAFAERYVYDRGGLPS